MRRSLGTAGSRDTRSSRSVTLTSSPASARAALRNDGIKLHAISPATGRHQSHSRLLSIHGSENRNILRAQRFVFLARTSAMPGTLARATSRQLLRQRTRHFVRHIHMPHHPQFIYRGNKPVRCLSLALPFHFDSSLAHAEKCETQLSDRDFIARFENRPGDYRNDFTPTAAANSRTRRNGFRFR